MAVHYRTQGIILAKKERGEADRVFTVYTKDFGRLALWARSERKIASKLRGGLELLCLSELEFINGKSKKTITDSFLIERYSVIRKDLRKLRSALRIMETLEETTAKEEQDLTAWNLLLESLSLLNNPLFPPTSCRLLYYYFFWNLLSHLGWKPDLALHPVRLRDTLKNFLAGNTAALYTLTLGQEEMRKLHEAATSHYLSVIKEVH